MKTTFHKNSCKHAKCTNYALQFAVSSDKSLTLMCFLRSWCFVVAFGPGSHLTGIWRFGFIQDHTLEQRDSQT